MCEEIQYRGYTIKSEYDDYACDPMEEFDGNVKYALFHNRYRLHNDTELNTRQYNSWDELEAALVRKYRPLAILPVYMYDHSGQTIRTTPFHCPWDSGQIGFAFINKACLKEWGYKSRRGFEKATGRTLEDDIRANVALYDSYISGEVYRVIVEDPDGNEVDSCSGFYGDEGLKDGIAEAQAYVDYEVDSVKNELQNA